jgi:hypothetical protein
MSQGPGANENTIEKLLIDRPSDFRFHAAYLVYSELWDKTSSSETKAKLNETVTLLSKGEIDYETFYRSISQYRPGVYAKPSFGGGARIETLRKRDWREKEARKARESRHRK